MSAASVLPLEAAPRTAGALPGTRREAVPGPPAKAAPRHGGPPAAESAAGAAQSLR